VPKAIIAYVKWVDSVSRYIGLFAMYLIFALLGILVYASIMKVFFLPSNWTVEMAQFVMVSYYLLGGAYTLQTDEHVRMDLLYGGWPVRKKAKVDLVTDLTLIFFLAVLLFGGVASTYYAYDVGERSYSAWRPYMLPVKAVMTFGILLTLLQAIAIFFKDWAKARGETIS
jgi:TRAP-type mannitol/chloroaromatic compound transport system permease small subunit